MLKHTTTAWPARERPQLPTGVRLVQSTGRTYAAPIKVWVPSAKLTPRRVCGVRQALDEPQGAVFGDRDHVIELLLGTSWC